jgi:hypothetical protein
MKSLKPLRVIIQDFQFNSPFETRALARPLLRETGEVARLSKKRKCIVFVLDAMAKHNKLK